MAGVISHTMAEWMYGYRFVKLIFSTDGAGGTKAARVSPRRAAPARCGRRGSTPDTAEAAGALEADAPAEFAPMYGVQVAELSPDRHGALEFFGGDD